MRLPRALRSHAEIDARCAEHRGKPSKKGRLLCYWDDDGIVRREDESA